jgi:hypothetical protein
MIHPHFLSGDDSIGDRADAFAKAVFYHNRAWTEPCWAALAQSFLTALIFALWTARPNPMPFLVQLRTVVVCYSAEDIRLLLEHNQPDLDSLAPELAFKFSKHLRAFSQGWTLQSLRRAAILATDWIDDVDDDWRHLYALDATFLDPHYTIRH